jgi:apoptosis-inducing factor 3
LIATGAEPIRLPLPGMDQPHVFTLRSLADSQRIIEAAKGGGRRAVVIGASFIGLEVAAALRAQEVAVTVVAPEARPLEKVLGPELGDFIRTLHEEHGVVFRLGSKPESLDPGAVRITGGETLAADFVVVGVGVRPATQLAETAGLTVDRGIVVDDRLRASAPGVFAAGDAARYPDPLSGERTRVEHWVVAERQGQLAARNILGLDQRLDIVPFFWSQHYDVPIAYVGHAAAWDQTRVQGEVAARDCRVELLQNGRVAAVATIYRDLDSLQFELETERRIRS